MKSCKLAVLGLAALMAAACGKTAGIKGTVAQAPESQVIVKLLDINSYKILDTISTDAAGRFSYKLAVAKGQPEFVYLFYGDTKIASLLLEKGDKVTVEADTLGTYSVKGSEESLKLQEVETAYSAFLKDVLGIVAPIAEGDVPAAQVAEINKEVSKRYVSYYRESLKYVLNNPFSLTSIPVLYHTLNDDVPVFNQATDALHFQSVCDSLKTIYPESKYVKALEKEAARRSNIMGFNIKMRDAANLTYPEIDFPDVNGQKVALSSVDAKVVLLHFWTASDATQKMFNIDVLLPIYQKYHDKGLEIYSVAIDVDKATWAASVKGQNLPWINVCDGLGTASKVLGLYNVAQIPTTYIIADGNLTMPEGSVEKALSSLLR